MKWLASFPIWVKWNVPFCLSVLFMALNYTLNFYQLKHLVTILLTEVTCLQSFNRNQVHVRIVWLNVHSTDPFQHWLMYKVEGADSKILMTKMKKILGIRRDDMDGVRQLAWLTLWSKCLLATGLFLTHLFFCLASYFPARPQLHRAHVRGSHS